MGRLSDLLDELMRPDSGAEPLDLLHRTRAEWEAEYPNDYIVQFRNMRAECFIRIPKAEPGAELYSSASLTSSWSPDSKGLATLPRKENSPDDFDGV